MYFYKNELSNNENKKIENLDLDSISVIIRGESSATEAYRKVEEKIQTNPEAYRLNQFRKDHENATVYWQMQAKEVGAEFENNSWAWGALVTAFIETTKVFGDKTALWILKQGEVHGLNQYRKMLSSNDILEKHKEMIRQIFIPRQKRHINCLEALLRLH